MDILIAFEADSETTFAPKGGADRAGDLAEQIVSAALSDETSEDELAALIAEFQRECENEKN